MKRRRRLPYLTFYTYMNYSTIYSRRPSTRRAKLVYLNPQENFVTRIQIKNFLTNDNLFQILFQHQLNYIMKEFFEARSRKNFYDKKAKLINTRVEVDTDTYNVKKIV